MGIKKYEFKKIISSPILIALTLIFLAYNTMVIINKAYVKDELKVLNEIVSEVGYSINDDMMLDFKSYYENALKEGNNLLNEKGYESYDTISEFYEKNNVYSGEGSKFSNDDEELLNKVSIIEGYYFLCGDLEKNYENIDINKVSEKVLSTSKYNKNINNLIKKDYEKFAVRFQELKANGEHKNLFFYGKFYGMHSFLFKNIFKNIIYEIMILIVLATAFILNYEFENKTALVIYSTKRGRNLIKDKLITSLIFTILITTIIIGLTLLIYFSVFDYSGLWGTSVNSFFMQEYNMPYLSWYEMSILKYLCAVVCVVFALEIIFCMITFILSSFVKNTYIVFGIFAIIVGSGLLLPTIIPESLNVIITTVYTPFTLIINPSMWFMFKGELQANKYYEIITLVVWSLSVFSAGALCVNKFKRESIK